MKYNKKIKVKCVESLYRKMFDNTQCHNSGIITTLDNSYSDNPMHSCFCTASSQDSLSFSSFVLDTGSLLCTLALRQMKKAECKPDLFRHKPREKKQKNVIDNDEQHKQLPSNNTTATISTAGNRMPIKLALRQFLRRKKTCTSQNSSESGL